MTDKDSQKIHARVKTNLASIREVLDRPVSSDDILGVQDKLIALIEISGLASHTESLAKAVYDYQLSLSIEIMTDSESKMGSNNLLAVAKGKISDYAGAVNYAERLGRNISHAIDGLRTVISLQKEEMSQNKFGEVA